MQSTFYAVSVSLTGQLWFTYLIFENLGLLCGFFLNGFFYHASLILSATYKLPMHDRESPLFTILTGLSVCCH